MNHFVNLLVEVVWLHPNAGQELARQVRHAVNQRVVNVDLEKANKWIATGARLFIFDEPTRGIDIGAKSEIFALLHELVAAGAAVLMISSEQSEIVNVCDRAYVMKDGGIAGQLKRPELSEEAIVRLGMHHA